MPHKNQCQKEKDKIALTFLTQKKLEKKITLGMRVQLNLTLNGIVKFIRFEKSGN